MSVIGRVYVGTPHDPTRGFRTTGSVDAVQYGFKKPLKPIDRATANGDFGWGNRGATSPFLAAAILQDLGYKLPTTPEGIYNDPIVEAFLPVIETMPTQEQPWQLNAEPYAVWLLEAQLATTAGREIPPAPERTWSAATIREFNTGKTLGWENSRHDHFIHHSGMHVAKAGGSVRAMAHLNVSSALGLTAGSHEARSADLGASLLTELGFNRNEVHQLLPAIKPLSDELALDDPADPDAAQWQVDAERLAAWASASLDLLERGQQPAAPELTTVGASFRHIDAALDR